MRGDSDFDLPTLGEVSTDVILKESPELFNGGVKRGLKVTGLDFGDGLSAFNGGFLGNSLGFFNEPSQRGLNVKLGGPDFGLFKGGFSHDEDEEL